MVLSIQPASEQQYTTLYGIMALAGEHMHRVLNLSHWYPFPNSDWFVKHCEGRNVYAVYQDELLVGTFMLSEKGEPYYTDDMSAYWRDASAPSLYFSAFALLPAFQQQGIGSWVMGEMDKMVVAQGHERVRFDAVANHPKLLYFYSRLGYRQCGELPVRNTAVMCYEKEF
jgi:GNAT superfamily N-acetyltransferase